MAEGSSTDTAPGKSAQSPLLAIEGVCQDFQSKNGESNRVLTNISFSAERQETICLLGPSGCGKSTILRVVSGMYQRYIKMPSSGSVRIRGQEVTGPHDDVLTVFQRPVLKAWLNVRGNIGLPFKAPLWGKRIPPAEQRERVQDAIESVGLKDWADFYPSQLSGGMQQRVSLAARLALRPGILCLDEPFSALDAQTRLEMQHLVLRIWERFPCLALFVTHDVTEALRIADRVIVLSTRPATIVMDITIAEPKPRPEAWFRSPDYSRLEDQIFTRIREATSTARGSLKVDV